MVSLTREYSISGLKRPNVCVHVHRASVLCPMPNNSCFPFFSCPREHVQYGENSYSQLCDHCVILDELIQKRDYGNSEPFTYKQNNSFLERASEG